MLFNAARGNRRRHAENIKKQPFEHTVWRFFVLVDKIGQQTAYNLNIQAHYLLHPSLFFLLQSCRHPSIDTVRCSAKKLTTLRSICHENTAIRQQPAWTKTATDVKPRNVLIYSVLQYMAFCLSICRILHDKRWPFAMQKATFHQLCYYLYLSRRMSAAIVPACPDLGLVAHV